MEVLIDVVLHREKVRDGQVNQQGESADQELLSHRHLEGETGLRDLGPRSGPRPRVRLQPGGLQQAGRSPGDTTQSGAQTEINSVVSEVQPRMTQFFSEHSAGNTKYGTNAPVWAKHAELHGGIEGSAFTPGRRFFVTLRLQ